MNNVISGLAVAVDANDSEHAVSPKATFVVSSGKQRIVSSASRVSLLSVGLTTLPCTSEIPWHSPKKITIMNSSRRPTVVQSQVILPGLSHLTFPIGSISERGGWRKLRRSVEVSQAGIAWLSHICSPCTSLYQISQPSPQELSQET